MKTLIVAALPYRTSAQLLEDIFKSFGIVGPIRIVADWENPTHEPSALLDVKFPEKAIEHCDGYRIGSAHLRVHVKSGGSNE